MERQKAGQTNLRPHTWWQYNLETSKLRLQKLQTWEAKLISGSGPRESRNPIFKEFRWLSLQNRRDFQKCIMVFKWRNGLAPEYLAELFSSNDTVPMYNTHNASQLRATRTRTAHYHCSFTVSGSNLWNDLPCNRKKKWASVMPKPLSQIEI